MDGGISIVLLEIALKGPVVGEAEQDQRASCLDGFERNNISAVIGAADPHQRRALDRMKIG
jgi:hypothetical protein